ncbi:gliding motility-associated C-terminal domain-containing protein [Flagellimonas pacifica]|nr:gliding motility-associated C-terminal domain-containing protein [Allomuricauda parva]
MACMEPVFSQCAGEDNNITICDKYDNILNRTYNLFANLNGTPDPGGTWSTTNSANLDALDTNSGIVDLWKINYFGEHQFTYTNNDCNESATVIITLGGYAGQDNTDGSANACGDSTVNLFSFLGSQIDDQVPDFNGIWEEDPDTETGLLNENFFNAEMAGPGEYKFTYTVPAVDICPSKQSTVFLEVHPAPDSGIPQNFVVCTTDDLSGYINLDLNDLLLGEDPNGEWTEESTNQIDNIADHTINVQEINNNFGYGSYNFTYSVLPTHPVCSESLTMVSIIILPVLSGNMEATNYCSGTDYGVTLNYGDSLLPAGLYQLEYRVNSSEGVQDIVTSIDLNNGIGVFSVSPVVVPINEIVQLDIIGIQGTMPEQDVCDEIMVQQVSFMVSSPSASAESICLNTDVTVQLTNILNTFGTLANGSHSIDYTLTNPENSITNSSIANINFVDGSASFNISAPNTGVSGAYTIDISIGNSFGIDCAIATGFQVIPEPENIDLQVIVDNNCNATSVDVFVDAPTLTDGSYTIDYEVIEQISQTTLIDNSINFIGGMAEYEIDIANLPDGDYSVILKSFQNDTTPCRLQFEFEIQENFAIGGIPEIIEAPTQQSFCLNNGTPTLEDISVNASGDISFFESNTDNAVLTITTPLVNGEDYYISSTNPDNNCVSQQRTRVQVTLLMTNTPTTTNTNLVLCGSENPTLADLNVVSSNEGSIIWYSSHLGGTMLDSNEILVDGQSYFATEQLNGFCESETRLEIIPNIINPPLPNLKRNELHICGLDNPTVNELINTEITIDGRIEWFDVVEGGEPLSASDLLKDNSTYYAQSYDIDSGCINSNRVPVTVDLNNCVPEEYGFFIPDGFSPNNDGKNDTFFIPNIEIIFPDFTLEIFNRYGNSLFKGDMDNLAWDGSEIGSSAAPNGIYFYIVTFNKEGYNPKQGRLYLNR